MRVVYSIFAWVFLFVFFFGLEIAALNVLLAGWRFARHLVLIFVCGGVALVLMAVESLAWFAACGGDPLRDWMGATLLGMSVVSVVSLAIYFPAAIMACKRRQLSPPPIVGQAGSDPSQLVNQNERAEEPEDLV